MSGRQLPKNALEWGLFIMENLPAGVNSLRAVKDLFGEFYTEVRKTHTGETTVDELRAAILEKFDAIEAQNEDIQDVDADGDGNPG